MQTTVKTVNYQHLMPTRYSLDVDLKTVFTSEAYSSRENLRGACLVSLKPSSTTLQLNHWFPTYVFVSTGWP